MNIIIVRHGQTDWNIEDKLQGSVNIGLNKTGIQQAKEISKKLSKINIDILYSSPLDRAIDTAKYINVLRNLNILIDNRLIERSFGDCEGINGNKIDIKKYWDFYKNFSNFNIESIQNLFDRCYQFLIDICKKYENTNKNILLVTHNGVNLAISSIINGYKQNIFDYNLKNCDYRYFENVTKKNLEESYGKFKI